MKGCPSKLRLGGLANSERPKQAAETSFQRPQSAKQFAEKALGIALFYHSCHSDAECGGGICGTEELCIRRAWTTDAVVNEQDSSAVGVGMTKTGCAGL
jgi:hypothetical protein